MTGGGGRWRTDNGNGKYGGLSTAQGTIKLSLAPVEMTFLGYAWKANNSKNNGNGSRNNSKSRDSGG